MAYTQSRVEHSDGKSDVAITSTGEIASFAPGYVPHILRAVSLVVTTALATTTAGIVTIRTNVAGTTTTGTVIDTITIPGGTAAGKAYYLDGLNTEIGPGTELQLVVTTAATSTGKVTPALYVEPRWETPANNSSMVKSA